MGFEHGWIYYKFSTSSYDTSPQGIFFKDDGTEMYVAGTVAVAPLVVNAEYVISFH